jgi:Predicted permeases
MFLTSLENVALLLAMAVPGFIVAKLKMIKNESAVHFISILLLYICQPFVTFNAFLNTAFDKAILLNLVIVFIVTAVFNIAVVYIGKLIMLYDKKAHPLENGVFAYAGSFGNIGYLCIPFLQILMPGNNIVILYAASAIQAFNIVGWTLGNYVITGDKKFISVKKIFLNPVSIAFILVLPFYILDINFLRFSFLGGVAKVVKLFSDMIGPMAMTMLGIKFAEMSIKELFTDYRVFIAAGIKLLLSPLIMFILVLLIALFADTTAYRLNLIALSAMPAANNLMMFTSMSGMDTKLPAKIIMVTTIFSIVTIPLALAIYV